MQLAALTLLQWDTWNTVCPCALLRAGISLICVGTHPAEVWFYDKVTLNLHSVSIAANIWLKWSPADQTDGGRDISSSLNFYLWRPADYGRGFFCQCLVLSAAAPLHAHTCVCEHAQEISLEKCWFFFFAPCITSSAACRGKYILIL